MNGLRDSRGNDFRRCSWGHKTVSSELSVFQNIIPILLHNGFLPSFNKHAAAMTTTHVCAYVYIQSHTMMTRVSIFYPGKIRFAVFQLLS